MRKIKSERQFLWRFILGTLLIPFNFILYLYKKRELKHLFDPLVNLIKFIFESRFSIFIIIINIIIFVWSLFQPEELINSLIMYPSDLYNLRLNTLITSGFLHANLAHLFGNMLGIFIFGRVVERRLGIIKTAIIYFSALLVSSFFYCMINLLFAGNNIGALGASGALMGLVSAAIFLDPFYFTYQLGFPLPIMVVGWLTFYADIAGIINPVNDGISHISHIGGFLSIILIAYLIGRDEAKEIKRGLVINVLSLIFFLVLYYLILPSLDFSIITNNSSQLIG